MFREAVEADDSFILRFSAWEGPIEAMLELARAQRIDLARIDMIELVTQFEAVVGKAMALRLELAADWLVMAAWLAYLKSKILLRRPKDAGGGDLDEDVLAFHLKRLDAVKTLAATLEARPVLGRDWYLPGGSAMDVRSGRLSQDLAGLMSAYPVPAERVAPEAVDAPVLKPFDLASVDSAIARLGRDMRPGEWTPLLELVPASHGLRRRSEVASTLIGSLELARSGTAEIRQDGPCEPIYVRKVA